MSEARFVKGEYRTKDHTAAADISAGQVVLLGNTAGLANGVAHHAISNGALGSLAIGGGVYECTNRNNSATGATVYWDDANNWVTSVSANMSLFGYISENGGGGTNSLCRVLHEPYYPPA